MAETEDRSETSLVYGLHDRGRNSQLSVELHGLCGILCTCITVCKPNKFDIILKTHASTQTNAAAFPLKKDTEN